MYTEREREEREGKREDGIKYNGVSRPHRGLGEEEWGTSALDLCEP